jgi:hypothetical protein
MSNPFDSTELHGPRRVLVLGDIMLDQYTLSYGVIPMTATENQCISDAARFTGYYAECWHNLFRATRGNPPQTICIPGCDIFGFPHLTYLSATDIECSSCAGFIKTVFTLSHECVHKRQRCKFNTEACMEWEAYKLSREHMETFVKPRRAEIVGIGKCSSEDECKHEIDSQLANEAHEFEYYKSRCWASKIAH